VNISNVDIKQITIHTFKEWAADGTLRLGAAVAYYAIIALIPILIISILLSLLVFTSEESIAFINKFLTLIFGDVLATNNNGVQSHPSEAGIGFFGAFAILFSASFLFVSLQDSLAVIWKNSAVTFSLKRYGKACLTMLLSGVLLIALIALYKSMDIAYEQLPQNSIYSTLIVGLYGSIIGICILTINTAIQFKMFIVHKVHSKSLFIGAFATALLTFIGIFALRIYFTEFSANAYYGAFANIFLLMIAIYYFAQIYLIGAQFTKVLEYRAGNLYLKKYLVKTDPRKISV
jgi:membrane protein